MKQARKTLLILSAPLVLGLSGCTKEQSGSLFGSIIGAIVGSEIGGGSLGTVIGASIGSSIGSSIGRDLDKIDRMMLEKSYRNSLNHGKSGETSTWHNPDTEHSGSFTPQEPFQNKSNQYCREFQQTVTIGGKAQTAYGTACRQPDGSWKIIS